MLSLALFWGKRVVVCVCAAISASGPGLEAARAQSSLQLFANRKVFRVGWSVGIMVESNGRGSGGALEASLQTKLHQDVGPMLVLLHPSKLLLDNLVMKPATPTTRLDKAPGNCDLRRRKFCCRSVPWRLHVYVTERSCVSSRCHGGWLLHACGSTSLSTGVYKGRRCVRLGPACCCCCEIPAILL